MGYRFFLVVPVLATVFLARALPFRKTLLSAASAIFVLCSFFSYRSYKPQLHDPPNRTYEMITDRLLDGFGEGTYTLVIAHKSLAEMIIYQTPFDALNWVPGEHAPIQAVLRVAHGISLFQFSEYLSEEELGEIKKLTTRYYAMPEYLWRAFLERANKSGNVELLKTIASGSNPMAARPAFLEKGKEL